MNLRYGRAAQWIAAVMLAGGIVAAQTAYTPKFPGDPARSDSEAAALGYMRTVLRAEKLYKRKNNHFATSLAELVHTGSFTRRMVNPDRGDYTVGFRAHKDKDTFELTMTPKQEDPQHRSFYADEDGVIHANEEGPADEKSPVVK
ncbi:MAG: hypothetical protein DMG88_15680 [Acidobacteria bacterium]|nr:MAG: hypothetical protein DMG88_15680 [Acidobacteriota bacterium]